MGKLQEILSDPESMKQIQELADMLNVPEDGTNQDTNSTTNTHNSKEDSSSNQKSTNTNEGLNMPFDMGMMFQFMNLLNSASNSQDEALLLAIKPYLSKERQTKVDKAIKLMKAYDIFIMAKNSGMLNNLDSLL